jgi:hypothetical protein
MLKKGGKYNYELEMLEAKFEIARLRWENSKEADLRISI